MGSCGGTGRARPIDAGTQRHVRDYVRAVFDLRTAERSIHVRRLDAGENHDVYKVSLPAPEATDVIVRVATSQRARDCATARREAEVLGKVRGVAAPRLYDFRCASPWFDGPTMCMEFIGGEQRPPAGAVELQQLGRTVGAVHALSTDDLAGWVPEDHTLAAYLQSRVASIDGRLPFVRDPLPLPVQRRVRRARSLLDEALSRAREAEAFQHEDRLVLLHGDVAGGNLLWSPAPVLIDWEYARVGDAADELAYIFNQNDLTESDRQSFWRGYREACGACCPTRLVERVRWWEPATVLGSAFFWLELWSRRAAAEEAGDADLFTSGTQAFYAGHTMQRLERAEALLYGLGAWGHRR